MSLSGLALLPRALMDEALTAARSATPDLMAAQAKSEAAQRLIGDVAELHGVSQLQRAGFTAGDAARSFGAGQAELGALHLEDAIAQFDAVASVLALLS